MRLFSFRHGRRSLGVFGGKFVVPVAGCLALALAAPAIAQDVPEQPEQSSSETAGDLPERSAANETAPYALSVFTTGVENREPIDQVTFVETDVSRIYFFSDLRGLTGQKVRHRWSYQGEVVAEVEFSVGGPRWRVWSSKELRPQKVGDWTVEIVLENDEVLASETFTYSAAPE